MTTVTLPREDSQEAKNAIDAVMREYNYPANPANSARVGWRAARLFHIALDAPAKPVECRGCKNFINLREICSLSLAPVTRPKTCTDFDKFVALPTVVLTKVTK